MPNIQFEQEKYGAAFSNTEASKPWFIRIIFHLGVTQSDAVANGISVIVAILIIVFAATLYLMNRAVVELPEHFKNLSSYPQDIYTTFHE